MSVGAAVNLEHALKVSDRNSGHTVQGHVDGVGRIESIAPEGASLRIVISTNSMSDDSTVRRYYNSLIVPKGFIAVDGASLTVCKVDQTLGTFTLMLIPHTQEVLKKWKVGDFVNIELDCLAKLISSSLDSFVDPLVASLKSRALRAELLSLVALAACAATVGWVIRKA